MTRKLVITSIDYAIKIILKVDHSGNIGMKVFEGIDVIVFTENKFSYIFKSFKTYSISLTILALLAWYQCLEDELFNRNWTLPTFVKMRLKPKYL